MGRKSKAVQNDLVELIVSKSGGGKNTIVYVTEEVNDYLIKNGLNIRFSREAIRRVIKNHEEQVADLKRDMDLANAFADIFRDNPGTEATESYVIALANMIGKEIRNIDGVSFEDPTELVGALSRLADIQLKMSTARTKACNALNKAKEEIKAELKTAITQDNELLEKLCSIVDRVQI